MCSKPRWWAKQRCVAAIPGGVGQRPDQVDAGPVAVVVDRLLDPVTVGVELGADVGQRVPLRRVLQREGHDIVCPHIDKTRAPLFHLAHVDVVEGAGVARHVLGRRQDRWVAALVQSCAARVIERQAQTETDAGLDLPHALEDFSGVSKLIRPSSSSSPQSPHVEPGGRCFHRLVTASSPLVRLVATVWPRCVYRPVGLGYGAG